MRKQKFWSPAAILALSLVVSPAAAQESSRQPHAFFKQYGGLNDKQIGKISQGEAVAVILNTPEKREVVVLGAVYVEAPAERYIEEMRDVEKLANVDGFLAVQRFGNPPQLSDVSSLSLDPGDLKSLRECKVDHCGVQITDAGLAKIQSSVDWSAPDVGEKVNAVIRPMLLAALERYHAGGNDALGVYIDKKNPLPVREHIENLLARADFLPVLSPELNSYLLDYPQAELPGAEDIFYWENVKFGLKPTLRVNHMVIYQVERESRSVWVVAIKQLYASHYFYTALDMSFCVKDTANPDQDGFFLITLKGSRQDGLTGFTGSILRSVVTRKTRSSMESALAGIKKRLEGGG